MLFLHKNDPYRIDEDLPRFFLPRKTMNILVIAAHPDDEVLGCGGTIARRASEGHAVSILILGEGITSRVETREKADPKEMKKLHGAAQAAGTSLGARDITLAHLPDNRFDTIALLDIAKIIEQHIDRVKPEVVFTQHGGDLNIDHVRTFQAALVATRPQAQCPVKRLYSYEVASSTEWAFHQFAPAFHPTVFTDISETLEKKIDAMQIYNQELRTFPHPRSPEALRAIALRWGSVAGLNAAEAFALIREVQP